MPSATELATENGYSSVQDCAQQLAAQLLSSDAGVQERAANLLQQLAACDGSTAHSIASQPGLLQACAALLVPPTSTTTPASFAAVKQTVALLDFLAGVKEVVPLMLADAQLLQGLVELMDTNDNKGADEDKWRLRIAASGALLKVVQHSDAANKHVSASPGFIMYLVRQLRSTAIPVTVAAARLVEGVALLPGGGRALVEEYECLERVSWLLDVTQYTNQHGLFDTTMSGLKRMAAHPENVMDITVTDALNNRYGVMHRLSLQLQYAAVPEQHVLACEVLTNLAEQAKAEKCTMSRDAIADWCEEELLQLLQHDEDEVVEAAAAVLRLLEWEKPASV